MESDAQFHKKNFRRLRDQNRPGDLVCPWMWKFWPKKEKGKIDG